MSMFYQQVMNFKYKTDDDNSEQLIDVIKNNYPILYDPKHPEHGNLKKKDEAFEEIANRLNFASGAEAKLEWTKLRNRHREALRRQKVKRSVELSAKVKNWQYQKQMSFLLPYMKSHARDVDSQYYKLDGDDEYNYTFEGQQHMEEFEQELYLGSDEPPRKLIKMEEPETVFLNSRTDENEDDEEKKCKKQQLEDQKAEEKFTDDALYHFFMSAYLDTRKMPGHVQCRIKRKIFSIINEEENALVGVVQDETRSSVENS